jgi:glutathione S-transferase
MRLYFSPASQYVRKVRVAAYELGLHHRLELFADRDGLDVANPLLKKPALVTDDGQAIVDSPVICDYLNNLAGGHLIPRDGAERWSVLTFAAIGDGVMEAISAIRTDRTLHAAAASADWCERQMIKIRNGIAAFDRRAAQWPGTTVTLDQITVGVMCGYIDFAFPEVRWREAAPQLATWYESFAARESMQSTLPYRA